ncbi:tyrosine-type recombinase/integrase [Candidatus Sulfurimonas baltica]|uniref:Site-specific integrase n=1 Tax=Candidatus Sulfurimonas baltica TaxID=2740404 RepID=A0A7S7RMA1_9BACT|nr:site-specific integrase [Candidatus Sulfurimonas baltica]QOY51359.1 site-specific integrase [Candidatus Sulfurimonas baltica]
MKKTKTIKRIKESITQDEYKNLMNSVRGDDTLRETTQQNLLRTFTILYFTGLRLNELQQMRLSHIKELIEQGSSKLILPKTKSERKLFAGDEFKKQIVKLFTIDNTTDLDARVITKGSVKFGRTGINHDVFIKQVNSKMKSILGNGYTSHSFRQGLITEMGSKQINTKIISKFIGHSDVKTTMRYINPTDEDLKNAMVR